MVLNDKEQEKEYNKFMSMLKEAIREINKYKTEVDNLKKELDRKTHQIKDVLKEYNSIQSYKKGTNDKERIRLKELFNIKFVASGIYGSGFFDGLRTAEEYYNKLNKMGGKK